MKRYALMVVGLAFAAGSGCSSDSDSGKVSYKSCDEVRAAGKAPLKKGDPGYSKKLDADGDGTACDSGATASTAAKMTFEECQKSAEYPGGKYAVEYDNGVCKVQKP